MKRTIRSLSHLWWGSAACTAVAALLEGLSVLTVYDAEASYFASGAPLPTLALFFALAGAILGTVAAFRTKCNTEKASPFADTASPAIASIGFLAAALLLPYYSYVATDKITPLCVLTSAALIISAVYSLFSALRKIKWLSALLSLAAALSCVLLVAYYYFDRTFEMNAPFKVLPQIALLLTAIYYVGEGRFHIGAPQPRWFLAVSAWTTSIASLSILSMPIAALTEKLDRADYLGGAILLLFLVPTVVLRMGALLRPEEEAIEPTEEATDNTEESEEESV